MKNQTIKENGVTTEICEFDSLNQFYTYISETPLNDTFRWAAKLSSVSGSKKFTATESYEEATELFKNGWSEMANRLVQCLKVVEKETAPITKQKNRYGVAGYQAIVPLYLNNCPNSMMYRKNIPVKQKVITLNKSINYNCGVKTEQIIDESVKALQIIKKLEAQGYRVNLNLIWGDYENNYNFIGKIRIKSASEKLNISKVAFPLVHPSMLRRLFFRMIEVFPTIPESFWLGYGISMSASETRKYIGNEYLLPQFIKKDVNSIKGIEDLENL